jgi:hypothetical protein
LHPGIADDLIDHYVAMHSTRSQFSLPEQYRTILRRLNGAHIFDLSLFGIPVSMAAKPPLLNRSVRQPFDLATANSSWSVSYKPEARQFHFGGGPYSWDENLGYFLNVDGSVGAKREGGQSFKFWPSVSEFPLDEIRRNEVLYGPHEERMAAFQEELR